MSVVNAESAGRHVFVPPFQPFWLKAVTGGGVAVLYMLSAFLGLKLAVVHGSVTAIWPPSGIALAALLLFGSRFWPAVMAGAFIVNYSTGVPLATGIGIATGNTLAALAGLQLVHRYINTAGPLDSVRSLLVLLGGGAVLAPVVSATVGVTMLALTGLAPGSELLPIWLTWWLGDAAGVIIFAPLFLAWAAPGILRCSTACFPAVVPPGTSGAHNPRCSRSLYTAEALTLAATLVGTAQLVFGGWFVTGSENFPLAFLSLPVLIWAGFRFGRRGATAAVATMSLLAIWGTVLGYGPFVHADLNKSLLLLQIFMCVNAFTVFMLVAVLTERETIRQSLQQARNELEQQVNERTRALLEANRFLLDEVREHRELQARVASEARCVQASQRRDDTGIRHVYERINRSVRNGFLQHPQDATAFSERLEAALQYAHIAHRNVALMHVAIEVAGDGIVTDSNSTGTGLQQQVAERLLSVVRDTDTLARRGEDEFAIILDGVKGVDDIASIAERIVHETCIPFVAGQKKTYLAASVGISVFPDDAVDAMNLCRHADAAMRLARDDGGRKYHFHIEERASIDAEVNKLTG